MIDFTCLILYSAACYKFINQLHQLCLQFWQSDKLLLYKISNTDLIKEPIFILSSFGLFTPLLIQNRSNLSFCFAVTLLNIFYCVLCFPDKNDVLESSKLDIGYGAALWYFKNYLTLFLPNNFLERVKTFESINKVQVDKKIYILVPESCIVQEYLDNDETDNIERCQELPKAKITNSGFKDRVYNITVYLVRNNFRKKRMAIEYAQPLKGLFAFKEKKFFTEEEMFYQRQLFVESLNQFLRDGKDLFKFCEIVEFNDKEKKVSDVLLHQDQFKSSAIETV